MQSSETIQVKVVHENYKNLTCDHCGTLLLPRKADTKILPGRFYCPNCNENNCPRCKEAADLRRRYNVVDITDHQCEYITTRSFFADQMKENTDIVKAIPFALQICNYYVVSTEKKLCSVVRKGMDAIPCELCPISITDALTVSYLDDPKGHRKYLHISCAEKAGLPLTEDEKRGGSILSKKGPKA